MKSFEINIRQYYANFFEDLFPIQKGFISLPNLPFPEDNANDISNIADDLIALRDINRNESKNLHYNSPVFPCLKDLLPPDDARTINNIIEKDVKNICRQKPELTMNDVLKLEWFSDYDPKVKIAIKTSIISRLSSNSFF